jgi:hypothetical protein
MRKILRLSDKIQRVKKRAPQLRADRDQVESTRKIDRVNLLDKERIERFPFCELERETL